MSRKITLRKETNESCTLNISQPITYEKIIDEASKTLKQSQTEISSENLKLYYHDEEGDFINLKSNMDLPCFLESNSNELHLRVDQTIKIMTYNIGNMQRISDWKIRQQLLCKQIEQLNPNVICFQDLSFNKEYANNTPVNMLVDVASYFPQYFQYLYCDNNGPGVGTLSQFYISQNESIMLSENCVMLRTKVQLGTDKYMNVYNIQTTSDNDEELEQAYETYCSIKNNPYSVLTGCFTSMQTDQTSWADWFLTGQMTYHGTIADLKDIQSDKPANTFPSCNPNFRPDRMYVTKDLTVVDSVVGGYSFTDLGQGSNWPSDHCYLLGQIGIQNKNQFL